MNRRGFFGRLFGFLAGLVFAPKVAEIAPSAPKVLRPMVIKWVPDLEWGTTFSALDFPSPVELMIRTDDCLEVHCEDGSVHRLHGKPLPDESRA